MGPLIKHILKVGQKVTVNGMNKSKTIEGKIDQVGDYKCRIIVEDGTKVVLEGINILSNTEKEIFFYDRYRTSYYLKIEK